jgi:hypothetical protein
MLTFIMLVTAFQTFAYYDKHWKKDNNYSGVIPHLFVKKYLSCHSRPEISSFRLDRNLLAKAWVIKERFRTSRNDRQSSLITEGLLSGNSSVSRGEK